MAALRPEDDWYSRCEEYHQRLDLNIPADPGFYEDWTPTLMPVGRPHRLDEDAVLGEMRDSLARLNSLIDELLDAA